jgi:hypothetical protein
MKKIFLALTILCAGAGAVHTARQSTTRLQQEANRIREDWIAQTQLVAAAQVDLAVLNERVRDLKQSLKQSPPVIVDTALWTALQTNRSPRVPRPLLDRVREELGFNWRFSPDYIVVSKQAVRDFQMQSIRSTNANHLDAALTDAAATVLAMTHEERTQIEAAIARVKIDLNAWALAHVERVEPKDDEVAHYVLPKDREISKSITNNFIASVLTAVGQERAELILPTARNWMRDFGVNDYADPSTLIVTRYMAGNEPRLKIQVNPKTRNARSEDLWLGDKKGLASFPRAFQILFPNGWADVAQREGFELPRDSQEK